MGLVECESLWGAYTAYGGLTGRECVELGDLQAESTEEGEKVEDKGKKEELLKIKKRKNTSFTSS